MMPDPEDYESRRCDAEEPWSPPKAKATAWDRKPRSCDCTVLLQDMLPNWFEEGCPICYPAGIQSPTSSRSAASALERRPA